MLHKKFKPAKCKTSLKLAVSRIKLLRNKREVQLRQMKRELAQLLESGQDRTARIRVEHVVREEKTIAAYDLIEIYCELIVARLPIVESQKNCPIDLKEAVSSIIFASPRCSDLPELLDVRKHFTAKYGKDFITSSLELRPDCGVNRMMVEKLSAVAPNVETKVKILTAIAQEHNVKWDPTSFGESELKPHEDLLNVPNVSDRINEMPMEPRIVKTPHTHGHSSMNWTSQNSNRTDATTPAETMHHSHTEPRASGSSVEGTVLRGPSFKNENVISSNRQNWNMEFRDATAAAQAAAESAERASRAARAAAEFSNRERMSGQYSADPHGSSVSSGYREELGKSFDPEMNNQQRQGFKTDSKGGASDSKFNNNDSKRRSGHTTSSGATLANIEDDRSESDPQRTYRHSQKSSSEVEDVYPKWQNVKHEEVDVHGQTSSDKQGSGFELDPENYNWHGRDTDDTDYREGSIRKESTSSPFLSTGYGNDDAILDSNRQKYGNDGGEHQINGSGQGNSRRETRQPSFNEYPTAVFDDYSSDDDTNLVTEKEYTGQKSDVQSPGRNSSRISENVKTWSSGQYRSGSLEEEDSKEDSRYRMEPHSPELSERIKESTVPSQSDDLAPAAFDDSDGIDSDTEEATDNFLNTTNLPQKQNINSTSPESAQNDRGHGLAISSLPKKETTGFSRNPYLYSSDDSESDDAFPERNVERKLNGRGESWKNHVHTDFPTNQPSPRQIYSLDKSVDDFDKEPSGSPVVERKQQSSRIPLTQEVKSGDDFITRRSDDNMQDSEISNPELGFGRLTGGFRNKGYIRPPYHKGDTPPLTGPQAMEDTPTITEKPIISSKGPRPTFHSDSDDDEVFSHQTVGSPSKLGDRKSHRLRDSQAPSDVSSVSNISSMDYETHYKEPYNPKPENRKVSPKTPIPFFDSDSDDSEVFSHQTVGRQNYLGGRQSRRTGYSPASSDVSGVSMSSGVPVSSYRRKFTPQSSDTTEPIYKTQTMGTGSRRTSLSRTNDSVKQHANPPTRTGSGESSKLAKDGISVEQQSSKSGVQTESLVRDESLKSSRSSSVVEQSSNPPPSRSAETSKASSSIEKSTSRESSLKKAGHVHPKLPDYDTLAAHFESLKSNR